MRSKTSAWVLLWCATALNVWLFVGRWAEPPAAPLPTPASAEGLASLAAGFGAVAIAILASRLAFAGRWIASALLLLLVGAWGTVLCGVPEFAPYFAPQLPWLAAGVVGAVSCFSHPGQQHEENHRAGFGSFLSFALLAFNFFLLVGPASSYLPSIVQDSLPFDQTRRIFYYGSVHSDMSPVSMGLRSVINWLFEAPSINATALSSMLYVSVGVALGAVAVQLAFGRTWGWALVAICCSDKWLFNAGVSSAVLGQPVLSVGLVMFLCSWAIFRRAAPLSWRDAALLGALNCFGVVYSLYSYSAARMTWLVGSGLAALILVARRAVWIDWGSVRKIALAVVPSIAVVFFIWSAFFGRDTERFTGQLLISPKPDFRVADVNSYSEKLIPYHDPDVPIWWGSARAETKNIVLHWRRTPAEVLEKLDWFFDEIGKAFLPPTYLVFLAVLGFAAGIFVGSPARRKFVAVTAVLAVVSFATYVLAQDRGAYRRAVATDMLFAAGVVVLFASASRGRAGLLVTGAVCAGFVALKAPLELNTQFDKSLWGYVCPICQPQFQIHQLVGSEPFRAAAERPMYVLSDGGNLSPTYLKCITQAVESYEFKQRAPRSQVVKLGEETVGSLYQRMAPGDVLVAGCAMMMPNDPALADTAQAELCAGRAPFGKLLGVVPPKDERFLVWWALLEKSDGF